MDKDVNNNIDRITIRPERIEDHDAIRDVTKQAFASMPYADGDEHELIGRFRAAGVLTLSLVAVRHNDETANAIDDGSGVVVGQVTLTPAFPANGAPGWYALGPVAVAPELQRRGIGSRLIRTGLDWIQRPPQNAAGCILVGNPEYYRRFGFSPFPALAPANVPAQFFQILPLAVDNPSGSDRIRTPTVVVEFHPLFFAEE